MALPASSPAGLAEALWDSLNEDNKVSLFARAIDLDTGEQETVLITKHGEGK